jgi:hypothetical protein
MEKGGFLMFCPEDGTQLGPVSAAGIYPPCPRCEVTWCYDGENGRYEVWDGDMPDSPASRNQRTNAAAARPHLFGPDDIHDMMEEAGKRRRELGVEKMVALIIDAMIAQAREVGQCTYYTGSFAVARETVVSAGLTCEIDPDWRAKARQPSPPPVRWIAFFGDDWEIIGQIEATKHLLAERS